MLILAVIIVLGFSYSHCFRLPLRLFKVLNFEKKLKLCDLYPPECQASESKLQSRNIYKVQFRRENLDDFRRIFNGSGLVIVDRRLIIGQNDRISKFKIQN